MRRLLNGLGKLSIALPAGTGPDELLGEIMKTASGNARIRLMVWRKTGGFYLPDHTEGRCMVAAIPSPTPFSLFTKPDWLSG
jgi:hypothetical protein